MIEDPLSSSSARPWQGGKEILLASLAELGLPRRLRNALGTRKCSLVGQLIQLSDADLFRIPAMGVKTVVDTQRILSVHSLKLGTPLPAWDQNAALEARKKLGPAILSRLAAADPVALKGGKLPDILLATLDEAGLPPRFINYLPKHGCELVGQLVQWTEDQLLRLDNLGSRSVYDAKGVLRRYGLTFGMQLEDWDDAEAFARRNGLLETQRELPLIENVPAVSADVPEEILLASLEEIGLPKRFLTQLPARGCVLVGQLIQWTEAELFRVPNMGRKSVYEARVVLASYGLCFGLSVPGWNDQTAMVRRATLGNQVRQTVFSVTGGDSDVDNPLEVEARRVFESVEKSDRNIEILMSLLGFDGLRPKTLDYVGQIQSLTRERVRQICDRARRRFGAKWRPTPRLEVSLQLLTALEPTTASHFSEVLREQGLARGKIHPQAIIEFARFVGKNIEIRRCMIGADEVYCSAKSEKTIRLCAHELRRATSAMGCTSLDRLAVALGMPLQETGRVKAALDLLSETVWLGNAQNWAMSSRPTRNRVANMAEKIFAVTEAITLPELRRCLSRSYRLAMVPAAEALTDLLELKGIAVAEGDSVRRLHRFSTDCLGSIELPFFLAFKEHGSPLSREQLEDICIDQYGVHPTSFWIYLSYSPIITKLAPGVYSLAGADVAPGAVEDVRLRTKATQLPSEHGWTQNGQLWCVSQLDRNNIRSGNRPIPAYVARLTEGDWTCIVSGGLPAGLVTIESCFARGLALAFSLAGAENGDLARFTFDLQRRSIEVRVGGSELTEDAAVGPGYFEEVEDDTELDLDDDPPASSSQYD